MERDIFLLRANKTDQDIAYRKKLATEIPPLQLVHMLSKQPNWLAEKGPIDVEKLEK